MMVVNITTSPAHAENIQTFMLEELRMSSALLFKGLEILGSRDSYPQPLIHLLDEPFQRVGHPDFIISKET